MKKLRIKSFVADYWQAALAVLFSLSLLFGILTFRLGSLTPGFAPSELAARSSAQSAEQIIENPLNAHQKASQFLIQKAGHNGMAAMRLPSVLLGFAAVICMFLLLRNWHTTRVSLLSTMLFAVSGWFLHSSRLATPDIAYAMLALIILGAAWLRTERHMVLASLMIVLSSVVFLYVPAMVWFLIPAIFWQRKAILKALGKLSIFWQSAFSLIAILGILPLAWALVHDPGLVKVWLGLPEQLVSFTEFFKNLSYIPGDLFIYRQYNPIYGIGHLPLIDYFATAMIVLGVFAYGFRLKLDRTKLLLGFSACSALLIAFGFNINISVFMPVLYIFAAAGIALMLQQWFTVFPRNPFARSVGVILVSLGVAAAIFYHVNSYFIAWPNVPDTKTTFSNKP